MENAHFRRRRRRRDSGVLADRRRCFSVHSSFPFILIVFLPLLPITWFSPRCWPLPTPAANQMRRHEAGEDPRWVLRPFSIGFFSWPIIVSLTRLDLVLRAVQLSRSGRSSARSCSRRGYLKLPRSHPPREPFFLPFLSFRSQPRRRRCGRCRCGAWM